MRSLFGDITVVASKDFIYRTQQIKTFCWQFEKQFSIRFLLTHEYDIAKSKIVYGGACIQ